MFNNKYNPDVLINYNAVTVKNKNTTYNLKNEPYNLIINDENILKDSNNFSINIESSKKDIISEYDNLINSRNFGTVKKLTKKNLDNIKKQFKLKNTEIFNIEEDLPEDHIEIKDKFISDFSKQEEDIKNDRQKYNSILDSLLEEGILD